MNTYIVKSGSMFGTHECPYEADAEAVALVVLAREIDAGRVSSLGILLSVSGGQYGETGGDEEIYFLAENLVRRLGRFHE